MLYVGPESRVPSFADAGDFSLTLCERPEEAGLKSKPQDIVLVDPFPPSAQADLAVAKTWLEILQAHELRFPPALFILVPRALEEPDRLDLLEMGYDRVLVQGVGGREFLIKARPYLQKKQVAQQAFADRNALEKSFGYLDRFKAELKQVKEELIEEKTSLNTALKQIQKMTGQRKRLKADLARSKETLEHNMEGFGKILVTLIQHQVEANRGHGQAVAQVAGFLGKELGFNENQLEDLRKAAMLHEMGLLFMSHRSLTDKIQTEASPPLTDYEKTLMVQYPVKGAALLRHCPGFENAAAMIYAMNEWADGTGFPEGLKRRYIPMGSRILAGADALENLKADPEVKDTQGLVAGLEAMAATRLDPKIVGLLGKYVATCLSPDAFQVRGIGIDQLSPGMTLGMPLFTATGTKLFSAGTLLTQAFIDKIIQYNREYPVDETVYIRV